MPQIFNIQFGSGSSGLGFSDLNQIQKQVYYYLRLYYNMDSYGSGKGLNSECNVDFISVQGIIRPLAGFI